MMFALRVRATRVARLFFVVSALTAALATPSMAQAQSLADAIDAYVRPHAENGDFAGAILVTRGGDIVFDKAYGAANKDGGVQNTPATSFHIGALSMAWTAAVVMHLADKHALALDNTVAQFLPDVPGGDRVTIRALLEMDPRSVQGDAQPYYLLARIAASRSGTSFAEALNALVFAPYWMDGAGIDNDDLEPARRYALGYVPEGMGLKPATAVHWSALAGEASLYATTRDELRFIDLLFGDSLLGSESRAAMFGGAPGSFGYGWYRGDEKAFGGRFYFASGRTGGFSSFVMHIPASDATVILLGNVDSAATEQMGRGIAALALKEP